MTFVSISIDPRYDVTLAHALALAKPQFKTFGLTGAGRSPARWQCQIVTIQRDCI